MTLHRNVRQNHAAIDIRTNGTAISTDSAAGR
jgi:hypothetical protein